MWRRGDRRLSDPVQGIVKVFVRSSSGDLVEYTSDDLRGSLWNAYDQSISNSGGGPVEGSPQIAIDTFLNRYHVFVRGSNGALMDYELWTFPGQVYDLTASAGPEGIALSGDPTAGDPRAVYDADQSAPWYPPEGLFHIYGTGPNGHLVEYVDDHLNRSTGTVLPWSVYDLSQSAGGLPLTCRPTPVLLGGPCTCTAPEADVACDRPRP